MSVQVTIAVGNPSTGSRTRRTAERFVEELLGPEAPEITVIELADYASELFAESERVSSLLQECVEADLLVLASPTYKATYTGLMKAFLDRYHTDGLDGVVTIPVQTGGNMAHSLATTQGFIPLLLELGAVVPGRGLYLPMDFEEEGMQKQIREAADQTRRHLQACAALSR